MTDPALGKLVRCWHRQAVDLATLLERSGGQAGWDEALAAFGALGATLDAPEVEVAVRRAEDASPAERVRYARALRGAATRAARRSLDRAASAA